MILILVWGTKSLSEEGEVEDWWFCGCFQRGLVPYNYLERLEISLAAQQKDVRSC